MKPCKSPRFHARTWASRTPRIACSDVSAGTTTNAGRQTGEPTAARRAQRHPACAEASPSSDAPRASRTAGLRRLMEPPLSTSRQLGRGHLGIVGQSLVNAIAVDLEGEVLAP